MINLGAVEPGEEGGMSPASVSRRQAVLGVLGLLLAAPSLTCGPPALAHGLGGTATRARFGAIVVDTSPGTEHGGRAIATTLRGSPMPRMRTVFGAGIAPTGSRAPPRRGARA